MKRRYLLSTVPNSTWPVLPADSDLNPNHVHVILARLDWPESALRAWWPVLSSDEQKRAGRFHFERDRHRYVAAHSILRGLLARFTGQDAASLTFSHGPYGKPELIQSEQTSVVRFNLSHSHEALLLGFTIDRVIGVDIEYMRAIDDMDDVAQTVFSPQEYATFKSVAPTQQPQAFFNGWSRKEAYIKATGYGMSQALADFDVTLTPGEPARLLNIRNADDSPARWTLHDLHPLPTYAAAVMVAGPATPLTYWQFSEQKH